MPSRVADILMEEARLRSQGIQQQGALWGNTIAGAAQIPLALREQDRLQQQHQLQMQTERLKQMEAAQNIQVGQYKLQTEADARRDEALTKQAVTKFTTMGADGHQNTDREAAIQWLETQSPNAAAHFATQIDGITKFNAEMQTLHLTQQRSLNKYGADLIDGVLAAPPEQQASRYATLRGALSAYSPEHPALQNLPMTFNADELKQRQGALLTQDERLKNALTESETKKNLAEAKKAEHEAPTEAAMDAAAQALLAKRERGEALTITEAADLKAYQDRKRTVSNPALVAATERQATAVAAQVAQQKRAQDFTQLQAARADLEKNVNTPYVTAKTSANTLRDVVEAAKQGNTVAGSLQALETTMAAIRAQGLNRINTAEIGVAQNAGSLWQNIQGWFGKKAEGEPVPASVQKDMLAFADILEKAAYKKYQAGHKATNALYGTSIPELLAGPEVATAPTPTAPTMGTKIGGFEIISVR